MICDYIYGLIFVGEMPPQHIRTSKHQLFIFSYGAKSGFATKTFTKVIAAANSAYEVAAGAHGKP